MNRRDFVKAACAVPLAAYAGCRCAAPTRFKTFVLGPGGDVRIPVPGLAKPVRFLMAGDTHFAFHDGRDDAFRDNYARMSRSCGSKAAFEKMLAKAKADKVDLVCLVGDTISFPTLANVEYVEQTLRRSGVRWLYVAGNHDWHFEGLPGADADQRAEWTEKRLKPLYQGAQPLCASAVVKGVRFVTIDNSIYHVNDDQLAFWKAEAARGDPTVLLMHVPLWTEGLDILRADARRGAPPRIPIGRSNTANGGLRRRARPRSPSARRFSRRRISSASSPDTFIGRASRRRPKTSCCSRHRRIGTAVASTSACHIGGTE